MAKARRTVAKEDQRREHDGEAIGFIEGVMVRSHPTCRAAITRHLSAQSRVREAAEGKIISVGRPDHRRGLTWPKTSSPSPAATAPSAHERRQPVQGPHQANFEPTEDEKTRRQELAGSRHQRPRTPTLQDLARDLEQLRKYERGEQTMTTARSRAHEHGLRDHRGADARALRQEPDHRRHAHRRGAREQSWARSSASARPPRRSCARCWSRRAAQEAREGEHPRDLRARASAC
jgi:hypothetical protein